MNIHLIMHLSQLKLFHDQLTDTAFRSVIQTRLFQVAMQQMHTERTRISDKNPEAGHTCFENMQKIQISYLVRASPTRITSFVRQPQALNTEPSMHDPS